MNAACFCTVTRKSDICFSCDAAESCILSYSASRALLRALGFREVGVYERHGQLDGVWRDVVIVERLLE